jgi:hypothetical protein
MRSPRPKQIKEGTLVDIVRVAITLLDVVGDSYEVKMGFEYISISIHVSERTKENSLAHSPCPWYFLSTACSQNFPHFSVAAIDAQGWFFGLIGAREIVSVLLERFELDEAVPF